MRVSALLLLAGAALAAPPSGKSREQRIIGGSVMSIEQYPHAVALLGGPTGPPFIQMCAGTILNNRSVLTAANCFVYMNNVNMWRCRVGSTHAHSGGTVFNIQDIIIHPDFDTFNYDNDFAILHLVGFLTYSDSIQPVSIAGPNYHVADNQAIWAIGWGVTEETRDLDELFWGSEDLRHVQTWTINQDICKQRYATRNEMVTDNMFCSGWLDVGGRDHCTGDAGGPLYHNNVQVGVHSWGPHCGSPFYPGVNSRVNRATQWIVDNA